MESIITFLEDAQPALAFVGTLLNISVLGFIIKLTQLSKSARSEQIRAMEEQKKIVEERLKNSEADLARTEKWYEKEKSELQVKLSSLINSENVSLQKLFENGFLSSLEDEVKNKIESVLDKVNLIENDIEVNRNTPPEDPQWYIEIAKGYTATKRWRKAAKYYGKYLDIQKNDWKVHFYQGVSYQNIRGGVETDFLASAAYSNAIMWMPEELSSNSKSRIYTYKGATLKRLTRLDEAEVFLLLGEKYACEEYEIFDNKYNLACIYAMKEKRKELFIKLLELSEKPTYLHLVRTHLDDYFINFANDPEFLELVR